MKMNEKNKITFKSSEEYYYYEKLGVKNNIVKLIDMKDMRFKKLLFNINLQENMYIEIG